MPQGFEIAATKPASAGAEILRTLAIFMLVVILVGLTFLGCAGVWVHFQERRQVVLPHPHGPFAVGRSLFDWTDHSRPDPYSSATGKYRELMVWMWYPAAPSAGAVPAEYIPGDWAAKLPWRPMTIPAKIRVHAVTDAPLAAKRSAYPVLIFSTGFGNLPSDYTALLEDLASRGYVILGITNTYSAPVVRFRDGRLAERLPAASFPRGPISAIRAAGDQLVKVWAADARFALDKLAEMNLDPQSKFYRRLDLAKVGVLGHAFGGAVAADVCSADPRCAAGVDIDGNLFGDELKSGIKRPFLFLLSDWTLAPTWFQKTLSSESVRRMKQQRDEIERGIGELCSGTSNCRVAHIQGTGHFNFTDVAVLYSPGMKLTGFLGPADGAEGLEQTASCISSFLDETLDGQSRPAKARSEAGCNYSQVNVPLPASLKR